MLTFINVNFDSYKLLYDKFLMWNFFVYFNVTAKSDEHLDNIKCGKKIMKCHELHLQNGSLVFISLKKVKLSLHISWTINL